MNKDRKLTDKQRIFIDEYLKCWNASEAARRAGYTENGNSLRVIGSNNLTKVNIKKEIQARLTKSAMSADEVLSRLAQFGRSDLGEFGDVLDGTVELADHPQSQLVKKIKLTSRTNEDGDVSKTVEIELHDAHSALRDIGKHHSLFTDKVEHSGSIESTLIILPSKDNDK